MGWNACRAMRRAISDVTSVVAIEAVCASEALELRSLPSAPATAAVVGALRRRVPPMDVDRFLAPDLAAAAEMVADGTLLAAAEGSCGPLQ
jgi:histidine ammonia-lyase